MSNFSLSGSMLAHQPAVWGVSGLDEHDGTHRALSGELMWYPALALVLVWLLLIK